MGQWLPDPVDNAYDSVAGVGDHAAGSMDEAVGRQFDDESGGGIGDGLVSAGQGVLDVPADAINATTGTGENLGWFGVVDRKLDPRSWGSGEDPDWAEPSEETTGISGFFRAASGASNEVVKETTTGLVGGLLRSPYLLAAVVVAALAMLGPYLGPAISAMGD